jgi:hypothetical protein
MTANRLSNRRFAPALCLVALAALCACAPGSLVVPPADAIAGHSQEEWSRAWWQWAGSFDNKDSPVADRSGALCDRRQNGDVWFLAGTYGTRRTVRTCAVPRGKYLFFPLINYVVMPSSSQIPLSCDRAARVAASMTDDPTALILEVDGVRVENLAVHRQATIECFDLGALTRDKIHVFPSAANGYYVMLRPLSPGRHTLNFGGALPSMLQAVTYTLEVK